LQILLRFENGKKSRNGKTQRKGLVSLMIRHCAKCGKEVQFPNISLIMVYNMGGDIYGKPNPVICYACHSEWEELWRTTNRKLCMMNQITWKKAFEKWLGYEWSFERETRLVWNVS